MPAPEVLHQGVSHLLVSVDRGCIQTKMLLSASLLFVLSFNSFPSIEVLFKSLSVELPFKNPSQK